MFYLCYCGNWVDKLLKINFNKEKKFLINICYVFDNLIIKLVVNIKIFLSVNNKYYRMMCYIVLCWKVEKYIDVIGVISCRNE